MLTDDYKQPSFIAVSLQSVFKKFSWKCVLLLKDIIRAHLRYEFPNGVNIIVIPDVYITVASYDDLECEVSHVLFLFYHWLLSNHFQHCKGLTNHPVVKGAVYKPRYRWIYQCFMNLRVSVNIIMHWCCIFPSKFWISVGSWSLQFVLQRNLASLLTSG